MSIIDVNFDFTSDTRDYWNGYWDRDPILGRSKQDPDSASKTMQLYHKLLYSRPLPNGEKMDLKIGSGADYLTWKGFRFGSDSIIASFRYKHYRSMLEQVAKSCQIIMHTLKTTYTSRTLLAAKLSSQNGQAA